MRIAAHLPLYPPGSRVGAWLSTHLCLAEMVRRGHRVDVVTFLGGGSDDITHAYGLDGVQVHPRAPFDPIADGADVILSHLGDRGLASRWAKDHGIPSVRMVHGIPGPDHVIDDDLVVFNSESLRKAVNWPGRTAVVHPPIDPVDYRTTPGDKVTLVNLTVPKGGALFWELARSMPEAQFLAVRGCYGQQVSNKAKNATVIDPTVDMVRDVYSRTRILLMPSEQETWGMAGIEAMASGIPVIAHPTPGLLESLGDAGTFVDRDDPDGWRRAIRDLLSPSAWLEASARARARAEAIDHRRQLDRFSRAVHSVLRAKAAA